MKKFKLQFLVAASLAVLCATSTMAGSPPAADETELKTQVFRVALTKGTIHGVQKLIIQTPLTPAGKQEVVKMLVEQDPHKFSYKLFGLSAPAEIKVLNTSAPVGEPEMTPEAPRLTFPKHTGKIVAGLGAAGALGAAYYMGYMPSLEAITSAASGVSNWVYTNVGLPAYGRLAATSSAVASGASTVASTVTNNAASLYNSLPALR